MVRLQRTAKARFPTDQKNSFTQTIWLTWWMQLKHLRCGGVCFNDFDHPVSISNFLGHSWVWVHPPQQQSSFLQQALFLQWWQSHSSILWVLLHQLLSTPWLPLVGNCLPSTSCTWLLPHQQSSRGSFLVLHDTTTESGDSETPTTLVEGYLRFPLLPWQFLWQLLGSLLSVFTASLFALGAFDVAALNDTLVHKWSPLVWRNFMSYDLQSTTAWTSSGEFGTVTVGPCLCFHLLQHHLQLVSHKPSCNQ